MMPVVLGMHVYCLFVFRVSNRKCNPSIYIIGNEQRAQDLLWLWLDFPISISMFIGMHYVWFSQFWSHFHGSMYCLPLKLKSTFFEKNSNGAAHGQRSEKKIQKTLIEVIVQPPKTHFLTFSCETKIMKITHSGR